MPTPSSHRRALLLVAALLAPAVCLAQAGQHVQKSEKEQKLRELIDLQSGGDFARSTVETLTTTLTRAQTGLPEVLVTRILAKANPDSLKEKVVRLWMAQLDEETTDAALTFYRSTAGQKLSAAGAKVGGEIAVLTMEWQQELLNSVLSDPEAMEAFMQEMGVGEDEVTIEFGEEQEAGEGEEDEVMELTGTGLAANEANAVRTLRTLATAQAQFQSAAIVDVDGNGMGEFGWHQELAGTTPYRTPLGPSSNPTAPAFITSVLGTSAHSGGGLATRSGYHFLLYLPTGAGAARRETEVIDSVAADAAPQEVAFVCYAWPVELGASGTRAFAVNQQGEVFQTENTGDSAYQGSKNIPAAGAAFHQELSAAPANAHGTFTAAEAAVDGKLWTPVE